MSQSNIGKYRLTTHIGAELEDGQTQERLLIPFPQREQSKQTPNPPNPKKYEGGKKASVVFNGDVQMEAVVQSRDLRRRERAFGFRGSADFNSQP